MQVWEEERAESSSSRMDSVLTGPRPFEEGLECRLKASTGGRHLEKISLWSKIETMGMDEHMQGELWAGVGGKQGDPEKQEPF